ncbi:MAG TPA: RES domain-containing protein [Thermohalobaculum sp.]|nr:RES domain-containing protein [Thermohalobaculum sp.]
MASSREVAWRLVNPRYAPGIDGEGARRWGGRWNSPGRPVVYAASSLALAVLEYFVHVPPAMRRAGRFPELVAVRLSVAAKGIGDADAEGILGGGGDAICRARGDAWLRDGATPALRVPSVIVPQESNLLLNPHHPDLDVRTEASEPFRFDPRLGG